MLAEDGQFLITGCIVFTQYFFLAVKSYSNALSLYLFIYWLFLKILSFWESPTPLSVKSVLFLPTLDILLTASEVMHLYECVENV